MTDIYDNTVAVYTDEDGAAAFIAKERKFQDQRKSAMYKALDALDMQGLRVLDVGCGFGRDVGEFRQRGAEAYGCDISGPLLEQANKEFGPYFEDHNLRDAAALPFGGGFDMLWCCGVFVHMPREELGVILRKMWDALAVGGRLVVITKCGEGETVVENLGLPRIMVYYRAAEFVEILKEFSADIEAVDEAYTVTAFGEALLMVMAHKV